MRHGRGQPYRTAEVDEYPFRPELTELLFIAHKEISEVSENPISRLSVISLIPTGYFR
jgi:hypothetical protein